MTSFLYKAFYKETTKEVKVLKQLQKVLLSFSVRRFQGSCFKMLLPAKQLQKSTFLREYSVELLKSISKTFSK